MNNFFKDILARPVYQRLIIVAASFLLPFLLFWQYVLNDNLKKQTQLEEQIEINESKVIYHSNLVKHLQKAEKEKLELELKLNTAISELPDSKEIPELLSLISKLVKESGLDIELFQPTGEEISDFYAKVPVSIHVRGTFHQILKFFAKVGNLTRIVNIDSIKMYNPEMIENSMIINTECRATTFRFLSEEERAKIKENQDELNKKNKKRK